MAALSRDFVTDGRRGCCRAAAGAALFIDGNALGFVLAMGAARARGVGNLFPAEHQSVMSLEVWAAARLKTLLTTFWGPLGKKASTCAYAI